MRVFELCGERLDLLGDLPAIERKPEAISLSGSQTASHQVLDVEQVACVGSSQFKPT